MRKLRILACEPNKGGCAYYRLIMPVLKMIDKLGDKIEVRWDENPLEWIEENNQAKPNPDAKFENIQWADIVFTCNLHKFGGHYTVEIAHTARKFNKFFHFDTDDLLTDVYEGHRHADVYRNQNLGEMTKYIYSISHLVTVTQPKFANRVVPFMRQGVLAIVRNCIDYDLPCWNMKKVPSKITRIGWVGGIHHEEDVKEFRSVMLSVNAKVGVENVKWNFFGRPYVPPGEKGDWQQDVWDNYQKILTMGSKRSNVQVFFAQPCDHYGVFYTDIDISIAPLQMNDFNDSKSEIKVCESGRYGIPLVATNIGSYHETIENGKHGYLIDPKNSVTEWTNRLVYLIKNKKEREQMGANLKILTDERFDINKHIQSRLDLYYAAAEKMGWNFEGSNS
jgi:glycosyltransferase involved in cell wall biosynthesis